jgi:hypothetical protein
MGISQGNNQPVCQYTNLVVGKHGKRETAIRPGTPAKAHLRKHCKHFLCAGGDADALMETACALILNTGRRLHI